jgi:hypothetical protein
MNEIAGAENKLGYYDVLSWFDGHTRDLTGGNYITERSAFDLNVEQSRGGGEECGEKCQDFHKV